MCKFIYSAKQVAMTRTNIKWNFAFSFKRKWTAQSKRQGKTMALDTKVNLAEKDKGSFCKQRE